MVFILEATEHHVLASSPRKLEVVRQHKHDTVGYIAHGVASHDSPGVAQLESSRQCHCRADFAVAKSDAELAIPPHPFKVPEALKRNS